MKRAGLQAAIVMALLQYSVGCASTDISGLFLFKGLSGSEDRVIVGELNTVALSQQKFLRGMGLKAVATPMGDAIHIHSETPNGAKFKLVLTRRLEPQGERTRIQVVWEGKMDNETQAKIMANVGS